MAASLAPLALFLWSVSQILGASWSTSWPETTVLRISATVASGQGKSRGNYFLDASYRYEVGDQSFLGSRVAFGERWSGKEIDLTELAKHLQPGTKVRYWPANPQVSVLLPGQVSGGLQNLWPVFLLGFLGFFALGFTVYRSVANRSLRGQAA